MVEKSKEGWKNLTLQYLEENKNRRVSIKEIFSMYGFVAKNLKDAVEELEKERKINIEFDEDNKKWLKHKD